jgi:3-oxoacyl-[acyl-carrier protein] reductase
MELKLAGEVAVITGAANGIGRGIALAMSRAGAAVALIDRDVTALQEVGTALGAAPAGARAYSVDVTDREDLENAVSHCEHDLGDPTILVTAAAIDQAISVPDLSPQDWQVMIDVNLNATFYCLKAVLPGMQRRGRGRVIFFGSNIALKGGAQLAHYGAAKAGVHGLARCAAIDLAPLNITVNVVAPGPVETNMLRSMPDDWLAAKRTELLVGRFGAVDDIVPTVLLLASPAGSFYTGATLNVSGGDVLQ